MPPNAPAPHPAPVPARAAPRRGGPRPPRRIARRTLLARRLPRRRPAWAAHRPGDGTTDPGWADRGNGKVARRSARRDSMTKRFGAEGFLKAWGDAWSCGDPEALLPFYAADARYVDVGNDLTVN